MHLAQLKRVPLLLVADRQTLLLSLLASPEFCQSLVLSNGFAKCCAILC